MFFTSSWACVLHYTTFTQGLLSGLDLIIYFLLFITHFVYLPSLQETECLFGNFLLSFTLSMTAKGRKVGGVSLQERGAKGIMHHSWVWEGKQAKLIRFFS